MLFVGIGGIFGAISRFLLGKWITSKAVSRFPVGTWLINISGSFLLGLLAALHGNLIVPDWTWLLLGTGFLGAYTTFSTFGYETIQLLQKKEMGSAVMYVSSSVVLGVLFAWLGNIAGSL
ncbi:fluoride efflux transporter CrcB [Paenibacillus lautus]|uniref:fluoride efflux transporter CrcB n=1 Tax=Paenibacillus lautus TaxID=1401 RepID=UPI002DBB6AC7|nr:fluoride efflux transporter CrcB [Paenibacillus lautus]MEC0259902.1 fluoride efflux transporter CrcB [Paenibacillus lautus]